MCSYFQKGLEVFEWELLECVSTIIVCHNEMPQIKWLKHQKFIFFLILWKLQVQDQSISRVISPEASLLGLQTATS